MMMASPPTLKWWPPTLQQQQPSPPPVSLTLVFLLCLSHQVTSLQSLDLLTSPSLVVTPTRLAGDAVHHSFLTEREDTTPSVSLLTERHTTPTVSLLTEREDTTPTVSLLTEGHTTPAVYLLTKGSASTRDLSVLTEPRNDSHDNSTPRNANEVMTSSREDQRNNSTPEGQARLLQELATTEEEEKKEEELYLEERMRETGGETYHHNDTSSASRMNKEVAAARLVLQDELDSWTMHGPPHLVQTRKMALLTGHEDDQWPGQRSSRVRRGVLQSPLWGARSTLFVELVAVADWRMYNHYRSHSGVTDRVRRIVNVANAFMNRLGIVVVLTDLKIWDAGDEITIGTRLNDTLVNMKEYRKRLLRKEPHLHNHNLVFLTRAVMNDDRVGRADIGQMCSEVQSVSVVKDLKEDPGLVGSILAHEMGHNLGMRHDDEGQRYLGHQCQCPTSMCIMNSSVSDVYNPRIAWSSCSREYVDNMLETTAYDCLKNVPTRMMSEASCGDGVVDVSAGEQCDCGPPEFCHNPCCVPTTCRLAANASCASGSCCDTQRCQPKKVGSECREAKSECDLPEYCSGESEYCPDDVLKSDGSTCWGGKGHCYEGQCGSHEGRCKYVWGPDARVGNQECFKKLNVQGNGHGNCGRRPTRDEQYQPCDQSSVLCGTLHCLPYAGQKSRFHMHHYNASELVGRHTCHFVSSVTHYPSEDWLSPSGSICGDGKMCVNQKCVEIAAPDGDCRDGCSGRGVCNNRGHCHCDPGFAPPDCSFPGLGGSYDSGHMHDVSDKSYLITLGWVLVVLLVASLFIVCCCWGYIRCWWDRRGRARLSPLLPCCVSCLDSCFCPIMSKTTRWIITVGSVRKKNSSIQKYRSEDLQEGEDKDMICSVDVDVKGSNVTKSWGVADEKLVTDLVTITPKNSPDLRRKIQMSSQSPVLHRKSLDDLDRPKYQQSISLDSGCVSDSEEGIASKRSSIHMSMTSLISAFMKFSTKTSRAAPEVENRRSRAFGSQKSMPLRRFVVDPLASNRNSRQGSPPPDHIRPDFRRSVSIDVSYGRGRLAGAPPPPPVKLKPHKSDENLISDSKVANSPFIQPEKKEKCSNNLNGKQSIRNGIHDDSASKGKTVFQPPKRPKVPFRKSSPPDKTSPPLPTLKESQASSKTDVAPIHTKFPTRGNPADSISKQSFRPAPKTPSKAGRPELAPSKSTTNHGNTSQKKNVMELARKFDAP